MNKPMFQKQVKSRGCDKMYVKNECHRVMHFGMMGCVPDPHPKRQKDVCSIQLIEFNFFDTGSNSREEHYFREMAL